MVPPAESSLTVVGQEDKWIPWPSVQIFVSAGVMPLSELRCSREVR